jgi:hypothetical protein
MQRKEHLGIFFLSALNLVNSMVPEAGIEPARYRYHRILSSAGASAFTRIRGYVSNVRKQSKNALDSIKSVFTANPTLA